MIGVCTTGEAIANDGRVYGGPAVSADTVQLPSFGTAEYNAVIECLEYNNQTLTDLGWIPAEDVPFPSSPEEMAANPSFLSTTYHYHGTMCPNTNPMSPGFHACDLSRMCRKWAGSTSVASGGMGVQCGREVAKQLADGGGASPPGNQKPKKGD